MTTLRREKQTRKGAPAYIMTFGDLMTQVLTFFILLNSYAVERKAELMAAGLGSFRDRLATHGLAPLTRQPLFEAGEGKDAVEALPDKSEEEKEGGPLDTPGTLSLAERIAEQTRSKNTSVLTLPGSFPKRGIEVPEEAWKALQPTLTLLRVSGHLLEVEGYAGTDEGDRAATLRLSLRRAQALTSAIEATGFPASRVVAIGRGTSGAVRDGPQARRLLVRIRRS